MVSFRTTLTFCSIIMQNDPRTVSTGYVSHCSFQVRGKLNFVIDLLRYYGDSLLILIDNDSNYFQTSLFLGLITHSCLMFPFNNCIPVLARIC